MSDNKPLYWCSKIEKSFSRDHFNLWFSGYSEASSPRKNPWYWPPTLSLSFYCQHTLKLYINLPHPYNFLVCQHLCNVQHYGMHSGVIPNRPYRNIIYPEWYFWPRVSLQQNIPMCHVWPDLLRHQKLKAFSFLKLASCTYSGIFNTSVIGRLM